MLAWYAVTTKPLQEDRAEKELRQQGFRVAAPKSRLRVEKKDGGFKYVNKPYLRGYLLLEMDPHEGAWHSINNTRGVGKLVMCGDWPSRIRSAAMEWVLKALFVGGGLIVDERALDEALLEVGDVGRVLEGPFGMLSGTVSDVDRAHARIGMMLEVFGRRERVEFPSSAIRKTFDLVTT